MWGMKRVLILLILCLGSSFLWAQKEEYFITLWELPKGELFFRDFTNKNNAIPIGTTLVNSKTNECYYPKVWVYGSETLSRFDIPENGMYTLYILSQEIEIEWWTSFVKSHFRGVVQWGNYVWNNARELKDLFITPVFANAGAPKLGMKSLSYFFQGFDMSQINVEDWDVSNVKDFSHMFEGCKFFDQDLGRWNVSNAVRMDSMFANCKEFHGRNLGNWNVSKVCDVTGMFAGCSVFNAPLNNWNVGAVKTFRDMFRGCESFDQDLGKWDVRSATNMSGMFRGCKKMNSPLNHWDVGGIKYMDRMFYGAESFNQPLDLWDVRQVLRMDSMFYAAKSFNQNLGKWELGENVCLGLQRCGMDVVNFSNTLYAWKPYYRTHQMRRIKATGLYYNEKGRIAKDTLESHRYYWNGEQFFYYDIDGARYLQYYVLFRKPEFVARIGEESLLKLASGGLDDDDWDQVELEVEDENILEVIDAKTLKIKGLEAGTTKVTLRVPEKDDVHKDLETTCTVTVKPSNKKTTTTPAATPAKKKQNAASRVRK